MSISPGTPPTRSPRPEKVAQRPNSDSACRYDLDPRGAAAYLGVHVSSVYRMVQRGEIPYTRTGRAQGIRFSTAELDEWLQLRGVSVREAVRS